MHLREWQISSAPTSPHPPPTHFLTDVIVKRNNKPVKLYSYVLYVFLQPNAEQLLRGCFFEIQLVWAVKLARYSPVKRYI